MESASGISLHHFNKPGATSNCGQLPMAIPESFALPPLGGLCWASTIEVPTFATILRGSVKTSFSTVGIHLQLRRRRRACDRCVLKADSPNYNCRSQHGSIRVGRNSMGFPQI